VNGRPQERRHAAKGARERNGLKTATAEERRRINNGATNGNGGEETRARATMDDHAAARQ
jgi:hypothetical protein